MVPQRMLAPIVALGFTPFLEAKSAEHVILVGTIMILTQVLSAQNVPRESLQPARQLLARIARLGKLTPMKIRPHSALNAVLERTLLALA